MSKRSIIHPLIFIIFLLLGLAATSSSLLAGGTQDHGHNHKDKQQNNTEDLQHICEENKSDKSEQCRKYRYSVDSYESLSFGRIVLPDYGIGIVRIDPASGSKSVSGGASDFGGSHSPAMFEITASPGSIFEVTIPTEVHMRPGNKGVKIQDITVWPTGILRIDPTGKKEFRIGGELHLPAGSRSGNYHARFPVYINHIIE